MNQQRKQESLFITLFLLFNLHVNNSDMNEIRMCYRCCLFQIILSATCQLLLLDAMLLLLLFLLQMLSSMMINKLAMLYPLSSLISLTSSMYFKTHDNLC